MSQVRCWWSRIAATLLVLIGAGALSAQAQVTFLNSFGSNGTGSGQFTSLQGIAVAPGGAVYAVDFTQTRVQIFDRSGTYQGQWGSFGTGNGQFKGPDGIAVGSDGSVYVRDPYNQRLQKFSSSGAYVAQYTTNLNNNFNSGDLAFGNDGRLYSVGHSHFAGGVMNWLEQPPGTQLGSFGSAGSGYGQISSPHGGGMGPDGNLYVADTGNARVVVFNPAGNAVASWGAGLSGVQSDVAVSSAGDVYVSYFMANVVRKFSSTGNLISTFGGVGSGAGQFNQPNYLTIAPTGEIYVSNQLNYRIDRWFDPAAWVSGTNTFNTAVVGSGQLLSQQLNLTAGKSLSTPIQLTVNADGVLNVQGGTLTGNLVQINGTASLSSGTLSGALLGVSGVGSRFDWRGGTLAVNSLLITNGAQFERHAGADALILGGFVALSDPGTRMILNGGSMSAASLDIAAGPLLDLGGGTLTVAGTINNGGIISGGGQILSKVNNTGEVRVAAGESLRITSSQSHANSGRIQLNGAGSSPAEIEFQGAVVNATGGLIVSQGPATLRFDNGLANNGAISVNFGGTSLSGDVANNPGATITIGAGTSALFIDDVVQNGTLRIATGSTATFLGSFSGAGGYSGDARFEGDLLPGNSPAAVLFDGSASFGEQLQTTLELAGLVAGTNYDQIHVTGNLILNGVLNLSLLNGFSPQLGDTFSLITAGTRSGQFHSVSGVSVDAQHSLAVLYHANGVTAVTALPGDATLDHWVDGADYTYWADNFLHTNGTWSRGDFNGDGLVDAADYTVWADHFAPRISVLNAAVVPEPSTLLLALLGILAIQCTRRRGKQVPVISEHSLFGEIAR